VAELRLLIGAAALYLLARRRRMGHVPGQWRELRAVALGSVAVSGFSVYYFHAVELSGVATSTVTAIGGAPILAGLRWAGIVLVLGGLTLMMRPQRPGPVSA
jgi:DME family drug/metabolite transporter